MTRGPLIDTSNRLLGWSTNDFSLYGGQAAVTIGAPATSPRLSDGLSIQDPTANSRASSGDAAPTHNNAAPSDDAMSLAEAPSAFHAMPFASPPIEFGGFTQASAPDTGLPAAMGSSASFLTAEALHAPLPGSAPFTPPTLAVDQPETHAPSLASVGSLTAPVLTTTDALAHLVGSVGTSADTLLAETQHTVDALPNLTDALFQDHGLTALDGFLGSDPAAGVTTLVSMVDSVDAFDLSHAGLDIAQLAPSGSILDTLADDAVPGALLGDVAHDADTLIPDHHHDGVLGIL